MDARASEAVAGLMKRLSSCVDLECVEATTAAVKAELIDACRRGALRLPEAYLAAHPDRYARRLLHREGPFTAVVMAWGPGQGTPLHDHAGLWCVECVVDGELDVTQYDLVEREGARCRFERRACMRATVGDAGCLIPPYEYHVLSNALDDRTSVTLHVYGGEMDHCTLFEPADDGWWTPRQRTLAYDA